MALGDIMQRVESALKKYRQEDDQVTLIAVSKMQPLNRIHGVLVEGQRVFGENYLQEALSKWPQLQEQFGKCVLHMIGPLQTNKAKQAVELFDVIHSLDRDSLAQKLANTAQSRGCCPDLFVQVNIGQEPQKAGISPENLDAFIAHCRLMDLPVIGLMCIPLQGKASTPYFQTLAKMAERNGLKGLSMGMSHDFEEAIKCGATHIRVGSAVFGERASKVML